MQDNLAERFGRFLASAEPGRGAQVISCDTITGGYSRISARAVVRWQDGSEEAFILRGDPPPGSGVFTSDRDAEVALLRALPDVTQVHTPVLRWYDPTGEFLGSKCIVMEAAVGATNLQELMATADDVVPLTDLFIDTVAALHRTPVDTLPATVPRPASWSGYLDAVLDRYDAMAEMTPSVGPVLRYAGRWARTHRPAPVPLGLTHGDCQPTNVLVGPDAPPLVIDWEFGHIGDPRADLGYYTQYPARQHAYWNDPDHFLTRYRAATGYTEDQVNPDVVDYFLLIGMGVLLEQLLHAAAAIGTTHRPGILAAYLVNAISHQSDLFLSVCDRLS